jgi:radical SAM superfamily enzyme YgiQ (UPF0313 family)
MAIHLVNPNESRILENAGDRLPIGLLSMAGSLKQNGHDVEFYDLNHGDGNDTGETFARLMRNLMNDSNAVVGISVYASPIYPEAMQILRHIKQFAKKTIAGGYHATAMPETLVSNFDSVVIGEGETGIEKALVLDGLVKAFPPDLERIPNPLYELAEIERYGLMQSGKQTGTLITSRGCPYHCAFCGRMDGLIRYEPLPKVREQIDEFWWKGFGALYFLDDVFTLRSDRMEEIAKHANHKGMPFRVTTRANLVDAKKLEILADNGCEWLSMGIESGSDEILKRANKQMTTQQNYDAIKLAKERGIKVKGFFILGLPGESEDTAKQTIEFSHRLREIGLTEADFYFMTPFPGTPIWEKPDAYGIRINDFDYTTYLEAGKGAHCVIDTEYLRAPRIDELVVEARKSWKN